MTISEAIEHKRKQYQEGLQSCLCFYAFSKEQFETNKIPKNAPNEEFISCGGGMYIHKSNENKLKHFLEVDSKKLDKEFLQNIDQKEHIYFELLCHECFYTEQPEDILEILKYYYTDESEETLLQKIKEVYSEKLKERRQSQ